LLTLGKNYYPMSESGILQPGQKVGAGRFTLVKPLGRGGMGEVWLAQDERLHEPVALKFLPPEIRADPAALDDLRRETARSHRLAHPNIVRIHDFQESEGEPAFISMEYVDGPTLTALRVEQPSRVLPWDYLRPLVEQLCAALGYAHGEHVVHRDLKPSNLMFDSRGRLKLADFGIAAVVSDSVSRISVRGTSGTLAYMSPQQLAGKRPQVTDDLYALGATLYELLTSKPPFYTGDITHQVLHEPPQPLDERLATLGIQNQIPADVAAIVMACLAKEPSQRPQTARAVAEWIGLGTVRTPSVERLSQTMFSQPDPSPADAVSAGGRKKLALAAVAALLLIASAALWYSVWHRLGGRVLQQPGISAERSAPVQPAGIGAATALPVRDGLILYFSFDEPPKEGVVHDESGTGNDGQAVGATWTPEGRRGGALQFARTNSYVRVPNRPSLNPPQITMAAWVKTSYSDMIWRRIFDKSWDQGFALSDGGETDRYHQRGRLIWEIGHHSCESQNRFDDGAWHHVVGTFDGTVQRLYLDNQQLGHSSHSWVGRVAENTYDLTIAGNRSDPDPKFGEVGASFDGLIDEVMIFNRALSPDEIRQLYESAGVVASASEAANWISLFDGQSVAAWEGEKMTAFPTRSWEVVDGVLKIIPSGPKVSLYTRETFRDFELEFEWRMGYAANSGVFYSAPGRGFQREFQLVDDEPSHHSAAFQPNFPEQCTGALWGILAPSADKRVRPIGEWNEGKLLVRGAHVEHWINGRKVLQFELGSDALAEKAAATKATTFKSRLTPGTDFFQPGEVQIGLQNMAGETAFRNIRIRRL